jgi:hypothetical protein
MCNRARREATSAFRIHPRNRRFDRSHPSQLLQMLEQLVLDNFSVFAGV